MTSTKFEAARPAAGPEATCAAEIIALHDAFEAWLGAPGAGDMARFEAALAPGFTMVPPSGALLDRAGVLAFLAAGRGTRGADFRIVVEQARLLQQQGDLVLMHYIERQWTRGVETARRATALFRLSPDGPAWLAVQETWITAGLQAAAAQQQ